MEQDGGKSHLSSAVSAPYRWPRRSHPTRQARQDGLDVYGEGADDHRSVEPYIPRNISKASVCRTPVEVQPALLGASSISILSSIVAILVSSRRRAPRPRSPRPSPPLAPANSRNQTATRAGKQKRLSSRTAAGSNGVLRVAEVGQGREAQSRTQWRDGKGWKARARWGAYKRWLATNPGCISISAKLRTASVSQCRAIRTLAGVITVQALRVWRSESSALRLSFTGAGGQQV